MKKNLRVFIISSLSNILKAFFLLMERFIQSTGINSALSELNELSSANNSEYYFDGNAITNNNKSRFLFKRFTGKSVIFSAAFIILNLFLISASFAAAKRVTSVTYGGQTGTALAGATSSVSYTITLGESNGSAPVQDNILLTWTSGAPAGVTWSFTSGTESVVNGTTTTPKFTPSGGGSTITFTITTSGSTPLGSYPFTLKITDNNAGGGPYSSASLSLVTSPGISYTGSPFTYYASSTITSLTPATTGAVPTGYGISPSLPTGLTFNSSTGVISGTPASPSAATTYTITASYSSGGPATTTINITVLVSSISYAGSPFTFYTGKPISTASSTEVGGNPTSYSAVLPAGLTINTSTGDITGTPTLVSGATNYTVTANYAVGIPSTTTINIKVLASTISYAGSPFTFNAGTTIAAATSTEVGGNPTTYSSSPGLPSGLSLNTSTGDITGTPTTPQAATNYTITATYTGGVTATNIINIKVQTPTISYAGSPFTFTSGTAITTKSSTEVNGNPTTYSGSLPAGLSLNASTGDITGTPTVSSAATVYTITANYNGGVTASTSITITVNPPAPVISYAGSPFTYYYGVAMSLAPSNTGGPAVSFSIGPALSAGLSFNTTTGVISGTPTTTSGAKNYTITATNAGGIGSTTINITIVNPSISYSGTPFTYYAGLPIATASSTEVGDSPIGYSVSPALSAGLSIDPITGDITGTPTIVAGGKNFTITANYASGAIATTIIRITVLASTFSYAGAPYTFNAGSPIVTKSATEVGGNPVSYSGVLPAGLTLNTSTGDITGTPITLSGPTNYTITATYIGGSTANIVIRISVIPNTISYSGSPFIYTTGIAISPLTPVVTGSPLSYSINTVLPVGLSFDTTTGIISGTPTVVSLATNYTITANYVSGITATTTINITVNPPAPVISYPGSPFTFQVGTPVSLTPNNTGGAVVSYSVGPALPAGLVLNPATGLISGTPTAVTAAKNYTITATNAGGTGSTIINILVNPATPAISYTPSTNYYTVGTAIATLTPISTGGPVASYSIDIPLPSGLNFNTSNGKITGTPTVDITATTFTITATNAGGSASTTINLTVYPLPPVIKYTPSIYSYTVGTTIIPTDPVNTGGPSSNYNIGPALPSGLTFDNTTGEIAGTPTASSPSTTYIISADNAGGVGTTSITISCNNPLPPIISYTPSTNVYTTGTAISILSPNNTGGAANSYSIDIALPAGLSFDNTNGNISGTPTATSPTTTYTVTGTNAAGSGSTTVKITVNPAAPSISYTPNFNTFTAGATITPLIPASTGGPVTSYSISTPLPAGLSFNTATGAIYGTPSAISFYFFYTITATNASGSSSTNVTIGVNNLGPAITYSPATVSYSVGAPITPATVTNTGGASSSFTINAALPSGLTFNTSNGTVSGTPTTVFPTTTYTIIATNFAGTSSTNLIITVSPQAPVISYTPSTNSYPLNAPISTLSPVNTGGAVTGYSYSSTGISLTGATLSGPSLMFIDASGNIYVANYNNKTVSRWNAAHTYLGTYEVGKGLTNPEGIVFDSAGNSYVEDTGAGAIYKYNSVGSYLGTIISGLSHPLGISIDPSNNLYIATYVYTSPYTSSVTKYNTSGTLLQTISNTQMDESDGVAVDGSGNVYVLNRALDQGTGNFGYVTKYNSTGTYIGKFSSGYNDPLAIACDPSGNVFVADSHNNQVKIYSSNGVLLNTISGFNDVEGFVADGNGNLYVSDFTNNTVKEFAANGGYHISAPLPAGLSFNPSNGQITGTPTVIFGPTTYTITAYNITGSGSTTVTLSCYQSNDWIGVTSIDWNTPSNWLGNAVPTSAQSALIGVNRSFNYFPNVLAGTGTTSVGSVQFGNMGGQSAGVIVNSGSTLNVLGALTYQSDANSAAGYTTALSGAGTITANSVNVISNTVLGSSYTGALTSSVSNLNVAGNIALTTSNSGSALYNSTFTVTGGTTQVTGTLQTTNTATGTSSFVIMPTTTATLQLVNSTALSGLSATGTNVVNFRNTGATVQYSGAAQTVYTSAAITGLPGGVNYQNIAFSGTGIKTASSGTLNIGGDFTNTLANDASNYVNLTSPTVTFNGTTQNLAAGGGNGTTLYKVSFSGAGTKTMVSGQFYLASSGWLVMSGSSASTILATGGLLTLNSDATGSATISAIPSGPSITGNVNVQRYVTGGTGYRSYRLASSPVYAGTVNSNNVYSINYVQNSIYLTGAAGGGFDKTGNPTLYLYREDQTPDNSTFISGNYWGVSSINSAPTYSVTGQSASGSFNIPVGNGFLFFFRGNRASASLATETTTAYTNPVSVTMSATGPLTQGQVTAQNWYTPSSSYLGYTGSGTGTNFAVRGFNLVGNPYASSIDWETFNTATTTSGIYGNNVSTTIYELNPATDNYDTYQKGGTYTNHGRRTVVSGQGFFVIALNNSSPQLIFNESAKSTTQNTGLNLFLGTRNDVLALSNANIDQHLRLQMAMDTVNKDDIYIGFNTAASTKFADNEDAPYKKGFGKLSLSSISSDNVQLAINRMPLPGVQQTVIPLKISAKANGAYSFNMTELEAIPEIYEVWLMDSYLKDSLDMRHNPIYAYNITADTNSTGGKRFQLVIRQNQALAIHLLNFTAQKANGGTQTTWVTENEQNYTHFTVERSNDGGVTYNIIGGAAAAALGTYSFLDSSPLDGANMYRLKIVDLNGTITYSNVITVMYAKTGSLAKNTIMIYPNPAKTTINLTINPFSSNTTPAKQSIGSGLNSNAVAVNTTSGVYSIQIVSASGAVIKTTTTTQKDWQTNVSTLLPGTYIMQVYNTKDNTLIGKGTFVKL